MCKTTAILSFACALALASPSEAGSRHGVPLPAHSRIADDGTITSSQGFWRTRRFYKRYLTRKRIAHKAIPVYRVRGTLVARYLSRDPQTPWLAIQIYKSSGRTQIYVVARSAPKPNPAPSDTPKRAPP